jgi:hypothetical protein
MNTFFISLRRSVYSLFFLVSAFMLLTAPCSVQASDIVVSARLNNAAFPVDEAVLLLVTVNGTSSAKPLQPTGKGLEFTYRGQSSQMQWINGKSSLTIIFTYMVQADKPGKHTIDPVRVAVDGKEFASQPLSCTVLPASSTAGSSQGSATTQSSHAARLRSGDADKIGFMRLTPSRETIYPGQLVPVVISAYFRQGLRVTLNSNPRLAGNDFILHSVDEKPVQVEKQINGEDYIELRWNGAVSPIKQGKFPLEFELDATLLVRVNNRRRQNDPFGSIFGRDPFFDDFFARYTKRAVKLASPKKQLVVKPLPEKDRPADFKGAIGAFGLAVAADPRNGKAGDPITLTMVISGTGNFDLVESPRLNEATGWKTYPATDNFVEEQPGRGKKTFEQAIVPTVSTIAAIPEVNFSYFDPDLEEYVTLHSKPIPLTLQQGSTPTTTAPDAKEPQDDKTEQPKQLQDEPDKFIPLHTEPGTFVRQIIPLYKKPLFQLVSGFSALCLLISLPLHLRRKRLENNPQILLHKKLNQSLATHFHEMKQAMDGDDQKRFIRHCQQAIQEYLALEWGVSARAITPGDIRQRMDEHSQLGQLFAQLEQAQFSGSQFSRTMMHEMLETTRKELQG